jgi:hypothetical protein
MFLNVSVTLNKPLVKCTRAVVASAISGLKNKENTGKRIVPKPNPEKKVLNEAKNAVIAIKQ